MTIKQLDRIYLDRNRLLLSLRNLIATHNTLIDSFNKEYLRHKKLSASKDNTCNSLMTSLEKSRNMKKILKEFAETRNRIIENQKEFFTNLHMQQEANISYLKDCSN